MEKYKMRLSGSFIVQCALNKYWNPSDIDLYTCQEIKDKIFSWADHSSLYLKNESECEYRNLTGIIEINNYVKDSNHAQPLQVISLERTKKKSNATSHINTFDFDICKNIYKTKNGQHVLKINNLSSIMNKKIQVNANMNRNNNARHEKYTKRGFQFWKTEKCDYVKYENFVLPIVICDITEQNKMSNIYFLGKYITDDRWENDNVIISYFESDMYSIGDVCHSSGTTPMYNMKMKIESGISFVEKCPIYNYCDHRLHDHKHSSISVYKKQTGEEYSCDVIVMKRIRHNVKTLAKDFDYERPTNDTYMWLDVRPKKDSCYADLIDSRDDRYVCLDEKTNNLTRIYREVTDDAEDFLIDY